MTDPVSVTQGVEMLPVDWSKPIEAVHSNGQVISVTVRRADKDGSYCIDGPDKDWPLWADDDGTVWCTGWRIRNVASPNHPAATGSVREAALAALAVLPRPLDDRDHSPNALIYRNLCAALAAAPTPDAAARVFTAVAAGEVACGHCNGEGDINHGDHPCFACGGSGCRHMTFKSTREQAIAIAQEEARELGYSADDVAALAEPDGDDLFVIQAVERALAAPPTQRRARWGRWHPMRIG